MPDRIPSSPSNAPRAATQPPLSAAQHRAKQAEAALRKEFNASRHLPKTAAERQLVRLYEGYDVRYKVLIDKLHRRRQMLLRMDDAIERATVERELALLQAEKAELEPKLVDTAASLRSLGIRLDTHPVDESLPLFVRTAQTPVTGSVSTAPASAKTRVRHLGGNGVEPHGLEFEDDASDSRTQH